MSQEGIVQVHSQYSTPEALAEAFAAQGNGDSLILVLDEQEADGAWVSFELLLSDGTVVLQASGRCVTSYPAVDGRGFETIVQGVEPRTGSDAFWEMFKEYRARGASVPPFGANPTQDVDWAVESDVHDGTAETALPPSQPPVLPQQDDSFLTRPSRRHTHDGTLWELPNIEKPRSMAFMGMFDYEGEQLPLPARAPRPERARTRPLTQLSPHTGSAYKVSDRPGDTSIPPDMLEILE